MPVVQRLQSLYQMADAGVIAAPAPSGSTSDRTEAFSDPDSVCTGVLLVGDLLAFAFVLTLVSVAWPLRETATASFVSLGCAFAAGSIAFFSSQSHYEHRLPFWTEAADVAQAAGFALVLSAASAFFLGLDITRPALLLGTLLVPLTILFFRVIARTALRWAGWWQLPVVVVGEGDWASQAAEVIRQQSALGYNVVACEDAPAFGRSWSELLRTHRARLLILAHSTENGLDPALVSALVRERVPYALLPEMSGLPMVGMRQTYLGRQAVLVSYRNNLRKPVARAVKMAFDLSLASVALLLLAPVMLVIAAIVGLDGGPVFFAHSRIGAKGRVFQCLKFRSMVTDSEAALQRLFEEHPEALDEWKRTHKLRRDPRVTAIGRILRKTSLDELPQLLNVLRLDMSLVGPRPIVSLEIPKYSEDIAYYYETRPGITGLWQVSGRSDTTYAQRVRLDSWYVKNWSLWQDIAIIARTIPAVVTGRGAG